MCTTSRSSGQRGRTSRGHRPVVAAAVRGGGDQHLDAGLLEHELQLVQPVGRVDVHHDRADPRGGVLHEHPLGAVDRPDADPVALGDAGARAARAPPRRRRRRTRRTSSAARCGTSTSASRSGKAATARSRLRADRVAEQRGAAGAVRVRGLGAARPASAVGDGCALTGGPPRGIRVLPSCMVASRSSIRRILPETVLGSSANSSRRTRLYGASTARECAKIALAVSPSGSQPSASTTYAFGHRQPQLVGRGHHRRLGDRLVLQQRALQLEGRDLVVGGLEDVVGCGRRR